MGTETTPSAVTAAILALCSQIDRASKPCYVRVAPDPDAIVADCFFNVAAAVAARGGTAQFGWIIWELPRLWLTAEFHSVWSDGTDLVDVTPKPDREERILFLPDTRRQYEYRPVKPIRFTLSNNGAVRAFCALKDQEFDILDPCFVSPATKGGATYAVTPEVEAKMLALRIRIATLARKVQRLGRKG